MDDASGASVSPKLVRRLVLLELTDLTVPPPADEPAHAAPLYYRVLPEATGALRVELWQVGSRSVSGEGGAQLTARRIALASAELARRLRRRREVEYARAAQEAEAARLAQAVPVGTTLQARTTLSAGVRGAAVGPADFWFAGPELRGGLWFSSGARLDMGASVLGGSVTTAEAASNVRWLELGVTPGYAFSLSPRTDLAVGMTGAVAAVHLSHVVSVDDQRARSDTWSARATGHARVEIAVADGLRFSVGPEVGAMLRPVLATDDRGQALRLGGLWAGAFVGVVFDPEATPERR
jgi:hypothetical protein